MERVTLDRNKYKDHLSTFKKVIIVNFLSDYFRQLSLSCRKKEKKDERV